MESLLIGVMVAGCGGGSDAASSAVDAQIDRVELAASIGDPVAVGEVLLASDYSVDYYEPGLMRSTDLGKSWDPLVLPGMPDAMVLDVEEVRGGMAVVSGRAVVDLEPSSGAPSDQPFELAAGDVFVWTSRDGLDWRGGRIAGGGPPLSTVGVAAIDDVLFVGLMTGTPLPADDVDRFELYRSDDEGVTWSPATVSGLELAAGESISSPDMWETEDGQYVASIAHQPGPSVTTIGPGGIESSGPSERQLPALSSADRGLTWEVTACPLPDVPDWATCDAPETAGGLQYRRDLVSLDGGVTWQQPSFDPPRVRGDGPPTFDSIVELPDGGWLATASVYAVSDANFGFAASSEDGLRWRVLVPESKTGRPTATVSKPIRFGDGWLVAHASAAGHELEPFAAAEMFLIDNAGTEARPIADTERSEGMYGQPVVAGDAAVVIERRGDDEAWVVRLRAE